MRQTLDVRICVLDDYQQVALDLANWSELTGSTVVTFSDHVDDHDQLVSRLEPFDVVVLMRERTPMPKGVLSALSNLRLLVTTGQRNDSVDVVAARELGITVCGAGSEVAGAATIELTWALILAVTRNVAREDASVRNGGWQRDLGTALFAKTLGIVGLGNLGSKMPAVAKALGMHVCGWSRNLTAERAREVGVEPLDHDAFFQTCDVVTVHLKLSDRSVGYVGAEEIGLMKRSAYLVNTSRGAVVDETALLEALRRKQIAGAALDVFTEEPLGREHPFRSLPNLLLSPHKGYVTLDSYRQFFEGVVEDIAAFGAGRPIREL